MGELKVLKPKATEEGEILLEMVEKWVKDRRDGVGGTLAAFAIVSVNADGGIGTMYHQGEHFWELLGATRELEHRMLREMREND